MDQQVGNQRRVSAKVALGETFRLALDALRSHKLRSFLTLLGIILAVATLVGVMSIVSGLNGYISDKVANLGANAFVVNRFETNSRIKFPPTRPARPTAALLKTRLTPRFAGG